jgi:hypothetical protein
VNNSEAKAIHERYIRALNTARDTTLGDVTRAKAQDAVIELRKQLDLHMLSLTAEREAAEDLEARRRAEEVAHQVGSAPGTAIDSAELREFTRPVDPSKPMQQHISVPIDVRAIERRIEYPLAMGDTTNTYGSYGVGTTVASAMLAGLVGQSALLEAGPKVFRTPTAEPLIVPTAADISADYRAEGSAATQDTVVMSKLELSGFHVSGYTEVTSEFGPERRRSRLRGRPLRSLAGHQIGDRIGRRHRRGGHDLRRLQRPDRRRDVRRQHVVHGAGAASVASVGLPGSAAQRPLVVQ